MPTPFPLTAVPDYTYLFIGGAITAAFIALVIIAFRRDKRIVEKYGEKSPEAKRNNRVMFSFALIILIVSHLSVFLWLADLGEKREAVAETKTAWVESHGLTVQPDTVAKLRFPEEAPAEDTKYGLAQVTTDEQEVTTVSLVWEDGEFVLYGTDGQPLEVIE